MSANIDFKSGEVVQPAASHVDVIESASLLYSIRLTASSTWHIAPNCNIISCAIWCLLQMYSTQIIFRINRVIICTLTTKYIFVNLSEVSKSQDAKGGRVLEFKLRDTGFEFAST